MKTKLLSAITFVALVLPTATFAYFPSFFDHAKRNATKGYVQDASLDVLPGWPDWIGRLDAFSRAIYGKRYQNLTATQKAYVEKLSKNWPEWIGVPFFLER